MIYYARYKNEKVVKDWKKSDCKKDYKGMKVIVCCRLYKNQIPPSK